jgi:hypothetical protein
MPAAAAGLSVVLVKKLMVWLLLRFQLALKCS